VSVDEYVIPAERGRDPGVNKTKAELKKRPASRQAFRTVVETLGKRAGISAHLTPHLMRHAFADHVAREAGVRQAQFLLGHATLGTTEAYLGTPTLDELTAATQRRVVPRRQANRCSTRGAYSARGADRNRTGVHGFAGRCVATPPRRRSGYIVDI
jgi:integrase